VNELVPSTRTDPPISIAAARLALENAADVASVASLVDRLEVIRVAARKAKASHEAQNDWATLKLEAERKAGRMLAALRLKGSLRAGRPNADNLSALADLGIEQQQSSRWQRLAAVPEERFARWLRQTREFGDEVTEAGLFALASRISPNPGRDGLAFTPAPTPDGAVPRNVLFEGDCFEVLRSLPDNCVDALVTDPPAAISMMGAEWDSDRGGRDAWVAWMTDVARECYRVMKPGAHGLVWSLPRTSHWTAWALENAGFEIRDSVLHVFFQGMPKSLDVSKDLDRRAGAEREIAGVNPNCRPNCTQDNTLYKSGFVGKVDHLTSPATDAARAWEGYGSGLKPAHETWWLIRKAPEGALALNVLRWGTGGLDIDGARVTCADEDLPKAGHRTANFGDERAKRRSGGNGSGAWAADQLGRWPANTVLSDPVFDGDFPDEVVGGGQSKAAGNRPARRTKGFWADKPEQRLVFQKMDGGGKSRFFLIPKASQRDRNSGVPGAPATENNHIAVKPLELMRHLVRLVAPKGGLVIDPFAGSGTTGVAAVLEGVDYLLIEQDEANAEIARARLGL
jgi:site-specific DNA-methyltransferase (adenine-specific)